MGWVLWHAKVISADQDLFSISVTIVTYGVHPKLRIWRLFFIYEKGAVRFGWSSEGTLASTGDDVAAPWASLKYVVVQLLSA